MHKSRLAGFIIDCRTDDLDGAATFWSQALGLPPRNDPADGPIYRRLQNAQGELYVEVQQVAHASRVHLDIESNDIEAEVRRLEALGATRVQQVRTWWVLQAPTGQRFCVVRPQSPGFERDANRWP
jgi:predicted enzyme related to lactoylglutathione lyase